MPATAAASPLLRAVLETPRALNDLYFVDHDEELHAALRADAFAARVPFKTLVALVDGLLAAPSLYEQPVQAGDDLAARPDAEPKLADGGSARASGPFASLRGSFNVLSFIGPGLLCLEARPPSRGADFGESVVSYTRKRPVPLTVRRAAHRP